MPFYSPALARRRKTEPYRLSAQSQRRDEGLITPHVLFAQVAEKPSSLSDEHQEASPCRMVVAVILQVSGQVAYTSTKDCDLNLCGSGIRWVSPIFFNDLGLGLQIQLASALGCRRSSVLLSFVSSQA